MWQAPDGIQYQTIPRRWMYQGKNYELSENPRKAKRQGWVETVPESTEQIQAKILLKDDAVVTAVKAVLARITQIHSLGVVIDDWTFKAIIDAVEQKMKEQPDTTLQMLVLMTALRAEWDVVVLHTGSLESADTLWPYLYEGVVNAGI